MGNPFNLSAPINNAMLDPLQGYDADVYVIDQATGNYILVGRFVSIQVMIRNTTEPYLTLNQRMTRYLDGEMNISWQMERGQLDSRVLQQTFGFDSMTPGEFIDRMPRFQISFVVDAAAFGEGSEATSGTLQPNQRSGKGELVLSFCKVDNLTIAATAGRSIVANRWEGLAEGITYVNRSTSSFSTTIGNADSLGGADGSNGLYQGTRSDPFTWSQVIPNAFNGNGG